MLKDQAQRPYKECRHWRGGDDETKAVAFISEETLKARLQLLSHSSHVAKNNLDWFFERWLAHDQRCFYPHMMPDKFIMNWVENNQKFYQASHAYEIAKLLWFSRIRFQDIRFDLESLAPFINDGDLKKLMALLRHYSRD